MHICKFVEQYNVYILINYIVLLCRGDHEWTGDDQKTPPAPVTLAQKLGLMDFFSLNVSIYIYIYFNTTDFIN